MTFSDHGGTHVHMSTLSERLSSAMEEAGVNDSELSRASGVPRATIRAWRTGARGTDRPSFTGLQPVATALHKSVEWLLGEGESLKRGQPREPRLAARDMVRRLARKRGYSPDALDMLDLVPLETVPTDLDEPRLLDWWWARVTGYEAFLMRAAGPNGELYEHRSPKREPEKRERRRKGAIK